MSQTVGWHAKHTGLQQQGRASRTMLKHMSFLEVASAVAHRSDMYHRHGAVVVDRRGRVLGVGFNYRVKNQGNRWSVHAEEAAIQDCRRKGFSLQHATMYVIRIRTWKRELTLQKNSKGVPPPAKSFGETQLRNSRPCRNCQRFIEKNRLNKVFFTATDL